jgi:SAM-dependent methyltransferase
LNAPRVFDHRHYEPLNRARGDVVRRLLAELKDPLQLHTAVDVGCGVGYFSGLLQSLGFAVTGVDGRNGNAEEAARRVSGVTFHTVNVEDSELRSLGSFDMVLCFGLLYHLESPFRAIRNFHALTAKVLFVESMCAPGGTASMELLDESEWEDQGLNHVAFYPTEPCLVKMLYRAGFPFVYGLATPPDHADFREAQVRRKARTMLLVSKQELKTKGLILLKEPIRVQDIWLVPPEFSGPRFGRMADLVRRRMARFALRNPRNSEGDG